MFPHKLSACGEPLIGLCPVPRNRMNLLEAFLAGRYIGTTANIYAHLDTTDLETALRALED